jgi:hypothetical protein
MRTMAMATYSMNQKLITAMANMEAAAVRLADERRTIKGNVYRVEQDREKDTAANEANWAYHVDSVLDKVLTYGDEAATDLERRLGEARAKAIKADPHQNFSDVTKAQFQNLVATAGSVQDFERHYEQAKVDNPALARIIQVSGAREIAQRWPHDAARGSLGGHLEDDLDAVYQTSDVLKLREEQVELNAALRVAKKAARKAWELHHAAAEIEWPILPGPDSYAERINNLVIRTMPARLADGGGGVSLNDKTVHSIDMMGVTQNG